MIIKKQNLEMFIILLSKHYVINNHIITYDHIEVISLCPGNQFQNIMLTKH